MNHKKIFIIALIITLAYFALTVAFLHFGNLGKLTGNHRGNETPMEIFILILFLPTIFTLHSIDSGQLFPTTLFILVVFAVFSGLTYLIYFIKNADKSQQGTEVK